MDWRRGLSNYLVYTALARGAWDGLKKSFRKRPLTVSEHDAILKQLWLPAIQAELHKKPILLDMIDYTQNGEEDHDEGRAEDSVVGRHVRIPWAQQHGSHDQ